MVSSFTDLLKELFIPDEEYWNDKFDYFFERYDWLDSFVDTVNIFVDFFTNTDFSEPPAVTINLSLANSRINYGKEAIVLDLSWYEPYKSYVDAVLSAFMLLIFGWNTWRNIPNIINGVGDGIGSQAKIDDYYDL